MNLALVPLLFGANAVLLLGFRPFAKSPDLVWQIVGLAMLVAIPILWTFAMIQWTKWKTQRWVQRGRLFAVGLFLPPLMFVLAGGSRIPWLNLFKEWLTTWYGLPRVLIFTGVPVLLFGWILPRLVLPSSRPDWAYPVLAALAGVMSAAGVAISDNMAGGNLSFPLGMFNFSDFNVTTHAAVNAMMSSTFVLIAYARRGSGS